MRNCDRPNVIPLVVPFKFIRDDQTVIYMSISYEYQFKWGDDITKKCFWDRRIFLLLYFVF